VIKTANDPLLFILSVDAEEEFNWEGAFPQRNCSVRNIQKLPEFQQFCDSLGVHPTYLVDYPVATYDDSVKVLREIARTPNTEIGAHLHPWCNPPLEGLNTERESHVVNLPIALVKKKITALTEAIQQNIGVTPKVFRTGRWGITASVLKAVADAGFTIDSSIYPFYENSFFSCKKAVHTPYWPDFDDIDNAGTQRQIFELPITAGFNRANFKRYAKYHDFLEQPLLKPLRPIGIAWKTGLLRKHYLSPELASASEMRALLNAAIAEGQQTFHMYLHSSTLLQQPADHANYALDNQLLYKRISRCIEHLQSIADVQFVTLSEAKQRLTTQQK